MSPPDCADLFTRFARSAARDPRRTAIGARPADDVGPTSYAELLARSRRLAAGFARRGVRRGDRVAFLCANRLELVVGYLAALAAGAALVPINTGYRRREIAHLLTDSEPRLLVVDRERAPLVRELDAGERASVETVVVAEELAAFEAAEERGEDPLAPLARLAPGDLALLLYTSGTTGPSKGAMLSHGNVLAMIASLHEAWAWTAGDALLLTLPLFHLHGLVNGLCCALAAGAEVALEPRFEAARALDRLERGEATLFFGVPTMYVRLVEELARRRPCRLPRVRLFVSGSAPLAAETFAAFRAATGHEILERYGMSETGMLTGNPLAGARLPGTVGTPLPGVELRLVDARGEAVAAGEEGEIEVRGPNVFSGYWRAPEKSAASFRPAAEGGRWFRTGDRGRVDPANAHLTLLGRASELILSGGLNVYPREIEEVLAQLPGVREAAVVGEPHPEFGESPVAFVVADGGVDAGALDAHCRRELAAFKLPRRYVLLDALPRNAMGKVEKRRLPVGIP